MKILKSLNLMLLYQSFMISIFFHRCWMLKICKEFNTHNTKKKHCKDTLTHAIRLCFSSSFFCFSRMFAAKFKSVFNACIFIDLFYDDFRNKKNEFSWIFLNNKEKEEQEEKGRMIIIIKMAQLICEHLPTI